MRTIEGIDFCKRELYNCTQQALDVVLRFYGYRLEDVLFDEWRFVYRRGGTRGVLISPGPLDMRKKFLDSGIVIMFKRASDVDKALSAMKRLIDDGRPVPVLMDVY